MKLTRRNLLAASGAASFLAFSGLAAAETLDNFEKTFGAPNYRAPSDSLRFLRNAQLKRTSVPRDLKAFAEYVDRLPIMTQMTRSGTPELYHLIQWNAFALDMTALDHATVQPLTDEDGNVIPDPLYAEQIGPHRSSRALAMVHIAMFEAINAIYRRTSSYKGVQPAIIAATGQPAQGITPLTCSVRAAIAIAAHDMLLVLYPKKSTYVELFTRKLVGLIGESAASIELGVKIGAAATQQILLLRKYDKQTGNFDDGSQSDGAGGTLSKGLRNSLDLEPTVAQVYPSPGTDQWRQDPITMVGKAIGGYWKHTDPFVLDPQNLFLPPGPPKEGTERFEAAYNDVRIKGGDPNPVPLGTRRITRTTRTGTTSTEALDDKNETFIGNFWAYDGTALLCAPPRLYNMIATSIALNERPIDEVHEMARYLALVNFVLADCGIAAWRAKYDFAFARPISYFRYHRPNDNSVQISNALWTPLGAPVSNGTPDGANLTPPFPAYPSGHAVFGGGLFRALEHLISGGAGTERFKFVSDEYNGLNRGPTGEARPFVERTISSFAQGARENARSRIYLGIHWQFDADDGIDQGYAVADYVVQNALMPLAGPLKVNLSSTAPKPKRQKRRRRSRKKSRERARRR